MGVLEPLDVLVRDGHVDLGDRRTVDYLGVSSPLLGEVRGLCSIGVNVGPLDRFAVHERVGELISLNRPKFDTALAQKSQKYSNFA